MLTFVKLPMKKNYHFFYTLDHQENGDPELLEFDSWYPDEAENFRDVLSYLDQQQCDIRNSVIKKLVDYAGRQSR